MLACEVKYIRHLRVGDIAWIYPARADSLTMDLKHNLRGGLAVFTENALQNVNHELHGRVVVIQESHLGQQSRGLV